MPYGYQKSNSKYQSDKSKVKDEFTERLVSFSIEIIKYCESLKCYRFLWKVFDQLIDSATSIGANREEAKSSSSRKDFIKFFEIALKSANETKFWLMIITRVAKEQNEIDQGKELLKETYEIANILGSSILTLKNRK